MNKSSGDSHYSGNRHDETSVTADAHQRAFAAAKHTSDNAHAVAAADVYLVGREIYKTIVVGG